jgi:hypothetical protein
MYPENSITNNMKILVSFLLLALAVPWSHAQIPIEAPADQELLQHITDILKECSKLKPGTTRTELLKHFSVQGGILNASKASFKYNHCPYIKVDVEFNLTNPNQGTQSLTDTIKSISKPYLDWEVID